MSISIINPVLGGGTLTDEFGWRSGFTKNGVYIPPMLHDAQDIAAPLGTPLYAGHDGVVTQVRWSDAGGGWGVQLQHPDGWLTEYWHMLEEGRPKGGDKVVRGKTRIGSVGNSGKYTVGAHVHYSLIVKGRYVDPLPYMSGLPTPNTSSTPASGQEEDEEMKLWIAVVGGTWYLVVPTGAGKPNAATLPGDSGMGGGGAAKAGIPVITFANVSALKKVANV